MKKNLFTILGIIGIIVLILIYGIYHMKQQSAKARKINQDYESFYNKEVLGTDLASLINKIDDANQKNNVEKDEKGLYINNHSNSIQLEVKFQELEEVIPGEIIEKQGIKQLVQNFGAFKFKCTKIEYHQSTGYIQYMYFEQV